MYYNPKARLRVSGNRVLKKNWTTGGGSDRILKKTVKQRVS